MAQGRDLWLEAKTHDNVSISIVNVHQATAKRHDLQRQVTLLLRAMIDAALTQRQIIGRLNARVIQMHTVRSACELSGMSACKQLTPQRAGNMTRNHLSALCAFEKQSRSRCTLEARIQSSRHCKNLITGQVGQRQRAGSNAHGLGTSLGHLLCLKQPCLSARRRFVRE